METDAQRASGRRERDKIRDWANKAFFTLALVCVISGGLQVFVGYHLYQEVASLRAEHTQETQERAVRLKNWDAFRSQLDAAVKIRDGEINLIMRKIALLEKGRVVAPPSPAPTDKPKKK